MKIWFEALNLGPSQNNCPVIEERKLKMEDNQGDYEVNQCDQI